MVASSNLFKNSHLRSVSVANNGHISILTLDNEMVLYNMCITNRDVAQPGSAPEWGSGGPGFKSPRPDHESINREQVGKSLTCSFFVVRETTSCILKIGS